MLVLAGLLVVGSERHGHRHDDQRLSRNADLRSIRQHSVGGKYIVQNNRWGTTATQCISATDDGFSIVPTGRTGNLDAPRCRRTRRSISVAIQQLQPGLTVAGANQPHHQRTQQQSAIPTPARVRIRRV